MIMDNSRFGRKDRLAEQKRHDTYQHKRKWTSPSVCKNCGVLYKDGRWQWAETHEKVEETTCPACQRIKDDYPAGRVFLSGNFFNDHYEELMNMIRNEERLEKGEHPMERIMQIRKDPDNPGQTLITTTGIHMARRIGDKLYYAYEGDLDYHYEDDEKYMMVTWNR